MARDDLMEETVEQAAVRNEGRGLAPSISVGHEANDDFLDTWLSDAVLRRGLAFRHIAKWHTQKRVADLPADGLVAASTSFYRDCAVLYVRDVLVQMYVYSDDSCHAHLYAEWYSAGEFEAAVAQLKAWFEPKRVPDPDQVTMGFRYLTAKGSRYRQRQLKAPSWAEIAGNYASHVRSAVSQFATEFRPGAGGKLVLFHGPPGTGKTYVIRALAREWAPWCRFEYITDPEKFFGDADYMMHVLIEGHRDGDDDDDESEDAPERWRLLVIEDAGELLARDAKVREGQGLSRLLNFGEGLLGQGLNVLTLISTNEQLAALNEAVSRPGRTAVEIEFSPLSTEECTRWLRAREERELGAAESMTLAELYAQVNGVRRPVREKPPIGLRR